MYFKLSASQENDLLLQPETGMGYQVVNESKNENERAAIENPVETSNGEEIFVRLSAFDDDKIIKNTSYAIPNFKITR
jgi:hypothetical protein